jgi:signal transduction histidine kinase
MLEAIEDGLVGPTEYMAAIQDQVRLLDELVSELFELARVESGAARMPLEPIELGDLAQACVTRFAAESKSAGVGIGVELIDTRTTVRGNPTQLERVLSNLVMNSLKYTPSGGWITVSLHSSASEVGVAVTDSGSGIPSAFLERAFEPFWREDQARSPVGGGAGLGLAISKEAASGRNGR